MKVGRKEERDEQGREGLRMHRNEEGVQEEEDDFVVLRSGGRYKRLKTGAEKGESCNQYEWREPCAEV
jgi:hypothetical protein